MCKVLKRDHSVVEFDKDKIVIAIYKAMRQSGEIYRPIADKIAKEISHELSPIHVSDPISIKSIEEKVYNKLIDNKLRFTAKLYEDYRAVKNFKRTTKNSIDSGIQKLLSYSASNGLTSSEVAVDNSNKDTRMLNTVRERIAGEVSKDYSIRVLLPTELAEAHRNKILHIHDLDYMMQKGMFNCCLIDIGNMLDNGTKINGVTITTPHSFQTACNLTSQIIASIASSQYGGSSVDIKHLAKYLRLSYSKNYDRAIKEMHLTKATAKKVATNITHHELVSGIQTLNYQINTLFTQNGQSPFITIFLNIEEDSEYEKELALIIKEIFDQRIKGFLSEDGKSWVTPSFPKLIYVLNKSNNLTGGKYDYLTELAVECTSKRMYPDYISSKMMKEHYNGNVFSPMGCQAGWMTINVNGQEFKSSEFIETIEYLKTNPSIIEDFINSDLEECGRVVTYHYQGDKCMSCSSKSSIEKKWCNVYQYDTSHSGDRCLSHNIKLVKSPDGTIKVVSGSRSKRVILQDISVLNKIVRHETPASVIFELPKGEFCIKCNNKDVGLENILYNKSSDNWLKITYKYSKHHAAIRSITVTTDHPLPLLNGEVVKAKDLKVGDRLVRSKFTEVQWNYAEIIDISPYEYVGRSYDVTTETSYFDLNNDILSHNCRSFLLPYKDPETDQYKFEGRFNQGVVTINLPQIGIIVGHDEERFWEVLDERLELCFKALMFRHHQFDGITSDISPIHWQDGAVSRLKPGEPIEKYLHNSYSTISLGYIGLYELTKLVKGVSHTDKKVGTKFALKVINHLKDKTVEWKEKTNIGFSLYGTPAENLCYVFAKHDKEVFGEIDDITDKGYYTNSYHVDVREDIDALDKLKFEEQFQKVSLGGCISYVEVPCMTKNTEALRAIIKWGYNHVQYFEFNSKLDYCNSCGFEGEIDLIQDEGTKEFHFKCPNCGETDQNNMHIVRRTCGYLGKSRWNQGKLSEFKNRFVHVGESEIIK